MQRGRANFFINFIFPTNIFLLASWRLGFCSRSKVLWVKRSTWMETEKGPQVELGGREGLGRWQERGGMTSNVKVAGQLSPNS